jgi:SP family sugar:H+ symporter-like MFS transporter
MQGFCVGTYSSIVPVMVKEYSPLALNGPLGAIQNIMIACGFLLGFIVPYLFSLGFKPETYWFYAFGFPLLTVGVHQILLMTIFTSETPKYLLTKGRNDEAKELIAMIYKEEYQDIIYHEKLADLNADNENDEGK